MLEHGYERPETIEDTNVGMNETIRTETRTADEIEEDRPSFVGISNWSLDPAKMNRGMLVQRGVPDENELVKCARLITVIL